MFHQKNIEYARLQRLQHNSLSSLSIYLSHTSPGYVASCSSLVTTTTTTSTRRKSLRFVRAHLSFLQHPFTLLSRTHHKSVIPQTCIQIQPSSSRRKFIRMIPRESACTGGAVRSRIPISLVTKGRELFAGRNANITALLCRVRPGFSALDPRGWKLQRARAIAALNPPPVYSIA